MLRDNEFIGYDEDMLLHKGSFAFRSESYCSLPDLERARDDALQQADPSRVLSENFQVAAKEPDQANQQTPSVDSYC